MTYETILTSVEDGIGTITLNRPDVFNAINKQMVDDLHAALEAWEQDDTVRAVVAHRLDGPYPLHRAVDLFRQPGPDVVSIAVRRGIGCAHDGNRGLVDRRRLEAL